MTRTRNYLPTFPFCSLRLPLLDSGSTHAHLRLLPVIHMVPTISLGSMKPHTKVATQPAWSIDLVPDLEGKVILVTGGSSGISLRIPAHDTRQSLISFDRCGEGYMQATSLEKREGLYGRRVARQRDCSYRRDGH